MTEPYRSRSASVALLTCVATLTALSAPAEANDAIFPALTAASAKIGWKNNYFSVNGNPTVINAGEIHYARVPRELWRERLVKMKRAGLNTVSTYVFWNAQEPAPGVFETADNLDLDAWLTEVESVGLYAIVRPGPYNCAEWLAGGIPQWITAKGLQIRNSSADYLAAVDVYYEKFIPIIAKHQIHKGGSVLWVQLENEHPAGWGTEGDAYLKHLYDKARSLGLEVPLYYSGLHHATDPTGTTPFGNRTSPWFSSETWSGWYSLPFGEMGASDLETLKRTAWKVIAFGGGGNVFYVFHGGTNFGYSGDTSTTSYDYRAPLGEESQLRQGYFAVRRPASFTRAFDGLIANSQDGGNIASVSAGLKTYIRKSANDGTVVFLDNPGTSSIETQIKLSSPALQFPSGATRITVAPNEIRPVVVSAKWTTNATLAYFATTVLGKMTIGSKTYYVCHGRSGEAGEIAVQYGTAPAPAPAAPWSWDTSTKLARATFNYPTGDAITELTLESGDGSTAIFLIINSPLADRTWFTDKALFVGATYVDEDLSIQLPVSGGTVVVYSSTGRSSISEPAVTAPTAPALSGWKWRDAVMEATSTYDDSAWASSSQPQPFGYYNFQNGYGWYRSKFTSASAGNVTVTIGGGVRDSAIAFANGKQVPVSNKSFSFSAVSGENTVVLLAKQIGLDKMYNVTGATGTGQYAGVWGTVNNGSTALSSTWKFRGGLGGMDETAVVGRVKNWTTFLNGTWADSQTTKSWPAFWRVNFASPLKKGVFATVGLNTTGLSSGSAWLNGHNLGRFSGNTLLYMPETWLLDDNTVVIYDVAGNTPNSVKLSYFETRGRYPYSGGAGGTGGATSTGGASNIGGATNQGGAVSTPTSMQAQGGTLSTTYGGSNQGGMSISSGTAIATASGGSGNTGATRTTNGGNNNHSTTSSASVGQGGDSENSVTGDAAHESSSGCSCSTPVSKHDGRAVALLFGVTALLTRSGKKQRRRLA